MGNGRRKGSITKEGKKTTYLFMQGVEGTKCPNNSTLPNSKQQQQLNTFTLTRQNHTRWREARTRPFTRCLQNRNPSADVKVVKE